jgi:hypothetical protein
MASEGKSGRFPSSAPVTREDAEQIGAKAPKIPTVCAIKLLRSMRAGRPTEFVIFLVLLLVIISNSDGLVDNHREKA